MTGGEAAAIVTAGSGLLLGLIAAIRQARLDRVSRYVSAVESFDLLAKRLEAQIEVLEERLRRCHNEREQLGAELEVLRKRGRKSR